MNIRERIELQEENFLIPQGSKSKNTRGRARKEVLDDIRTAFMIDRDRIIHCKSFRRLKKKTQVYIKTYNDHYRTRLTHTLEVAQIGKTIGRGIGLNEDLIEAISLAHDIGHVAFAHSGEEILNEILPKGFNHNENTVRVLTKIEKNGMGLNLTEEVLNGVLHHSGFSRLSEKAFTLEGQIVKYSDKIAYVNHDIDDSIRAGILKKGEMPKDILDILGYNHGERIDTLVKDCISTTLNNIEKGIIEVGLSERIEESFKNLRNFMFSTVYNGSFLQEERKKAKFIISHVYEYFYNNNDKLPEFYRNIARVEGVEQGVADYIAGMSDEYCIQVFRDVFIPK